jgi:hypothetical protein
MTRGRSPLPFAVLTLWPDRTVSRDDIEAVVTRLEEFVVPSLWKAMSHEPASTQEAKRKTNSNDQTAKIVCFITTLSAFSRNFLVSDEAGYYPAIYNLSLFFYVKNALGQFFYSFFCDSLLKTPFFWVHPRDGAGYVPAPSLEYA